MLKIFILIFVFSFLYQFQAFGQLDEINSAVSRDPSNFTIWIPNKMISGQEYEGIIVLDKPSNQENIFFLSANDKSTLEMPLTIAIPPLENHGIFKIKALRDGNATVFGALDGNLVQISTMVYASNSQASLLKIIIPTTVTKAQSMQAYIFTEDKFGLPEPVYADTEISITSSSMITAPQTVTIPKGKYYAPLPLVTRGSGMISVSSDNLGVATANVTKIHDAVTVKLALAPDIVLPNSLAYYYIWLEKDGKQYTPPYTIHTSLTSSNTNVSRFGSNYDIKHFNDISYSTTIRNGIAKGFVYTRNSGSTVISASVDGFGTASANLIVGSSLNNQATGKNITSYCSPFSTCNPNMVKIWIYPTTFDESGYGIVGLYREINQSNTSVIIPLEADSSTIQLSSNGSEINSSKLIHMIPTRIPGSNEETGVAQAIEFPIESDGTGNFTLTASGPGEIPGLANFNVRPKYDDSYSIKIIPLPIKARVNQDLGMMFIADSSGAMVEPSNVFTQPPKVDIQSIISMPKILDFAMTNIILTGTIEKKSDITASIPGLPSYLISLVPIDIATDMEFELPPKIHVGEKFPYVVYKTDTFGIPLERIVPSDVSTNGVNFDPSGKYMSVNQEGMITIAMLSDNGAIKQSINSFYNEMNLNTDANTVFKVGKENIFNVKSNIDNVVYDVQSIFPVVKKGNGLYSVTPTREQNFDMTIFAHKDGFRPISKTIHLVSRKIIDVTIMAKGNDGTQLHITPKLVMNNQTIIQNTPFVTTVNAGSTKIDLPSNVILQTKNYVFHMIDTGGQAYTTNTVQTYLEEDSDVIAYYDLVLSINATGATGSGFYPYGTVITLTAPEKWLISFLVRQVFDHWEGVDLPFDSKTNNASFVAKENISTTAVYRTDYTYLMLLIAGLITGIFAVKKHNDISWHVGEIKDKLDKFIPKRKRDTRGSLL